MSLNHIFNIASSALHAETARMAATSSNMANANTVSGKKEEVYKPQYAVFAAIQQQAMHNGQAMKGGVEVREIQESQADPEARYEPNNPVADEKGYVYAPNINYVEQMTDMISASRSYQMNLEMMGMTKQLLQRTLQLGQ